MVEAVLNPTKKKDQLLVDPRNIEIKEGFNVRQNFGDMGALKASIKENGVLVALSGYKKEKTKTKYILTSGHRRLKAVMELIAEGHEFKYVPMSPEKQHRSEEQRILEQGLFNDGKPLLEVEEGDWCKRLETFGHTQQEIAVKIGKTQAHVSNRIKLAEACKFMKNCLIREVLSASVAMQILKDYPDEAQQKEVVEKAIGKIKKAGKGKITVKHIASKKAKAATSRMGKYQKKFADMFEIMKNGDNRIYTETRIDKIKTLEKILEYKKPETILEKLIELL